MERKFDFSGWATRNDLVCSDRRVIVKDAFKHNDGQRVPLVWDHQHNSPENVLGYAILENRDEGVYAYCTFNDTKSGRDAKLIVEHGDVAALSIFANNLKQVGNNVVHGKIIEVSLVLAGANPGAFIDSVMSHSDGHESDNEAVIYTGEPISLYHSDTANSDDKKDDKKENGKAEDDTKTDGTKDDKEKKEDNSKGETLGDVLNTLTDKQQTAVYGLIANALDSAGDDKPDGENDEGKEDESKDEKSNDEEKNKTISGSVK